MTKLKHKDYFFTTKEINFTPIDRYSDSAVKKIFNFAYAMAFAEGHHRSYRSGGRERRKNGQIFINAFQGKLAELAVSNTIKQYASDSAGKVSKLDLSVHPENIWDDYDIIYKDMSFGVKSTKYYGNLLLLETKDWNEKGEYIPNIKAGKKAVSDYFVLVRIKPSGEDLLKQHKILYSQEINKDRLFALINSRTWLYDIPGYIKHQDLQYIIRNQYILPQGSVLNKNTEMDADNYYIQSGDMKNFIQLLFTL